MTIRHRHAFLDFVAILAIVGWSGDASAQVNAFATALGLSDARGGCIESERSCATPRHPQRSPHRPRRDEVRSRARHSRRPVGDGAADLSLSSLPRYCAVWSRIL
jgi:hypothetical protein